MGYFPVMLDLTQKPVLVVGGGSAATMKIGGLIEARPALTVVSPEAKPPIVAWAIQGRLTWVRRLYHPADLNGGVTLVFAATQDSDLNRSIVQQAQVLGILAHSATDPAAADFIVPAQVRRNSLILAVSTGGRSPALAKKLSRDWDAMYGPEWGPYVELMGWCRQWCRTHLPPALRGKAEAQLWALPLLELIAKGGEDEARRVALAKLEAIGEHATEVGDDSPC